MNNLNRPVFMTNGFDTVYRIISVGNGVQVTEVKTGELGHCDDPLIPSRVSFSADLLDCPPEEPDVECILYLVDNGAEFQYLPMPVQKLVDRKNAPIYKSA